jgi:hypothetical protein
MLVPSEAGLRRAGRDRPARRQNQGQRPDRAMFVEPSAFETADRRRRAFGGRFEAFVDRWTTGRSKRPLRISVTGVSLPNPYRL